MARYTTFLPGLLVSLVLTCSAIGCIQSVEVEDSTTTGGLRIEARGFDGAPLPGVAVRTQPANIRDTTDADGFILIEPIEEGTYLVFGNYRGDTATRQVTVIARSIVETGYIFTR